MCHGQDAAIWQLAGEELIIDLWGPEAGSHARSAIGVAELPFGLPVEIEAKVAVD
jgi:enamine deaminase RidA (YjgF/YER057c/UK114 family)